jgi:hypothetical protein
MAAVAAAVGAVGGACLMAAHRGRDFGLTSRQRRGYGIGAGALLLIAVGIAHYLAAPLIGQSLSGKITNR